MNYRIILSPDARAAIRSAARWYQREDISLAFRFVAATKATLDRVAQNPKAFMLVGPTIRRALIRKFPYAVYFTLTADFVFVRAVIHQRRRGSFWLDRGNGSS